MILIPLYVFGLCEGHSEFYRRDVSPFEISAKGRLFVLEISINWPSNRNWQT